MSALVKDAAIGANNPVSDSEGVVPFVPTCPFCRSFAINVLILFNPSFNIVI